jgi:hypothetical protein
MLQGLETELEGRQIELGFAEMKDPVKDRLLQYGLTPQIGRELFFPTLGVAVRKYLEHNPVPWVDWEDEHREGGDHEPDQGHRRRSRPHEAEDPGTTPAGPTGTTPAGPTGTGGG